MNLQLTVNDIALAFQVEEKTVLRWIHQDELPAYPVNGQFQFIECEVIDWAKKNALLMKVPFGRK